MVKEVTYRKVYSKDRLPQHSEPCKTYSTELGELRWDINDWFLDMAYERPKYWFEPIEESTPQETIIPISTADLKCEECNIQPAMYDYHRSGH